MKKIIIISILVSLMPIGIIGGGLYWAFNKNTTFEKYLHTRGIIIRVNADKVFDYPYQKRNFYYPTIMYYYNGESYTFNLKNGSENYGGMVGEEIDLLLNPNNPEDVIEDSFLSNWFGPVMVCTVGIFILIIGIIISAVAIVKEMKQTKT